MIIGLIYKLEAYAKAEAIEQQAQDALEELSGKRLTVAERERAEYPLERELRRARDEVEAIRGEVKDELETYRWPDLLTELRKLTGRAP